MRAAARRDSERHQEVQAATAAVERARAVLSGVRQRGVWLGVLPGRGMLGQRVRVLATRVGGGVTLGCAEVSR